MVLRRNSNLGQRDFFGCELKPEIGKSQLEDLRDYEEAFAILKPEASPFSLVRVGPEADGGYLLPEDFEGVTACFSPGVGNRKGFEDQLAGEYGIRTHMCDFSSDEQRFGTPLLPNMQTFKKLWLDVSNSVDSIRLDTWVNEFETDLTSDLILQMDIEGAEYRNILACDDNFLKRFRFIILELHGLDGLLDAEIRSQVLLPFLKKIGASFSSIHVHPNNCCGDFNLPGIKANIPRVLEITFCRKDRLSKAASKPLIPPMLPHPNDISHCVPGAPPLYLNKFWTNGDVAWGARLRRLEDDFALLQSKQSDSSRNFDAALNCSVSMALRCRKAGPEIDRGSLKEVAVGQSYFASSAHPGSAREGIVPASSQKYFFHTKQEVGEWITIDLEQTRLIRSVAVGNRRDACFDRAKLLFVILHNSKLERHDGVVYHLVPDVDFLETGEGESGANIEGIDARYVSILSPLYTALHLSGIRVYADSV